MPDNELYEFDGFRLDVSERVFARNGEAIRLSEKTFDTLAALVRRANRLASKDELMAEIWPETFVEENNLDKNISILRKVFDSFGGTRNHIQTVRGHGYRFVADITGPTTTSISETEVNRPEETAPKSGSGENTEKPRSMPNIAIAVILAIAAVVGVSVYLIYLRYRSPFPNRTETTRIAVLPFKPISSENRNEALELGMSDALIDKLNAADGIIVTPLSSVRRFGALEQDSLEAGRQLAVDSVLDGSVQISGDRLRVSARLLQVKDGKQLWAQQFDEKFTDIFSVQDSVSHRVADALRVRLGATRQYTENAEAYGLYLKARYLSQKASFRDVQTAIDYLKEALRLDPKFAPAYVVLADAYRATVLLGDARPLEAMPLAKDAAMRAIEIDSQLAEAHAVLGWILFWFDWDWAQANRELERALELDPKSADARQYYAHLLSNTGQHDAALIQISKALEIEPLSLRANALRGIFLINAGRLDEADSQFRKTLELQGDFRLAQMFLVRTLNEKRDYEEALSLIRQVQISSKQATEPRALEADTLARMGRYKEAEDVLSQLLGEKTTRHVSNYGLAAIYNSLGKTDAALDRLEAAFSEKDALMVFLLVDRRWDGLRSNPRFVQLMKGMHFEQREDSASF